MFVVVSVLVGGKLWWVVHVYRSFFVLSSPICVGDPGQLLHS
jgi:hypothetical protein